MIGGLGNQLFQYALGRRLSLQNNVPLKIDYTGYSRYKLHSYQIDRFCIQGDAARSCDIVTTRFGRPWDIPAVAMHMLHLRDDKEYYKRCWVKERILGFDENVLSVGKNAYLWGYWQSEKYFDDIANILRNELVLKNPPEGQNKEVLNQIDACEAVSVHIRRGDYVAMGEMKKIHDVCTIDYYMAAIKRSLELCTCPHFYIFSNDMPWVQQNLHINAPITFVQHNDSKHGFEDLRLMSACKHHIIANSTFSWWGAWLSKYAEKIVIAPNQWANVSQYVPSDIIPEKWIRIGI
ncbi:MAG: alpha-1,2-fucosyltransferase [Spirochaetes bacterium]|nr:alpha-1,2-fucosyltransferase [Spirochaetota bacterium]